MVHIDQIGIPHRNELYFLDFIHVKTLLGQAFKLYRNSIQNLGLKIIMTFGIMFTMMIITRTGVLICAISWILKRSHASWNQNSFQPSILLPKSRTAYQRIFESAFQCSFTERRIHCESPPAWVFQLLQDLLTPGCWAQDFRWLDLVGGDLCIFLTAKNGWLVGHTIKGKKFRRHPRR